jgi:hypothetical protein
VHLALLPLDLEEGRLDEVERVVVLEIHSAMRQRRTNGIGLAGAEAARPRVGGRDPVGVRHRVPHRDRAAGAGCSKGWVRP